MVRPVGKAEAFELLHGQGIAPFAPYTLVEQRQSHILEGVLVAYEIERLENETYLAVAQVGGAVLAQVADEDAVENIFPRIVAVEDAEDIQQCALSGAGSAHDGHQLAAGDIKVDILEHVQGHRPGVGFIYVFKMYHSKYAPIGSLAIKDAIVCRKLHSGEKNL